MKKSLYENTARFYDKGSELQNYYYDIDFYKSFVDGKTNVLELGCGTGRITLEILNKCNHITGLELSDQMLDILKRKVERLDIDSQKKVELVKGDMRDFNLNKKFDLIIFPGITFQALLNKEDRDKCLNNVKKHLACNGKIIIDFFHPDINKVNRTGNKRQDFKYYDDELNCDIRKYSVIESHDNEKQIHEMKYAFELVKDGDVFDIIEDYFELSYLYTNQVDEMFSNNGLNIDSIYGWYDFSKVDEDNKRMLIYVLSK